MSERTKKLIFLITCVVVFLIPTVIVLFNPVKADSSSYITVADPYPVPAVRLGVTTQTTQITPNPIDGDCESWIPLLNKYGIPYSKQVANVMYRESRCSFLHNYNRKTKDDSWGPFQVNLYGKMAKAYESAGFPYEYVATVEGSIAVAAFLYKACGLGPWTRPYSCKGGWPL